MTAHAILSASGSYKWLNCPGSIALEAQFPDTGSPYAEAGTLAHSIGELKLRKHFKNGLSAKDFKAQLAALKADPVYQDKMDGDTSAYVDYVKEIATSFPRAPVVLLETRVDFSDYAPEGFGTADCILIGNDQLHIVDYKNGTSPVDAFDNPQLRLYALGAVSGFGFLYRFTEISVHIVQPNKKAGDPITSDTFSVADLLLWGEWVKDGAKLALSGDGECKPGDWCDKGFCRARGLCRARAVFAQEDYDNTAAALPPLLSHDEVGKILFKADAIKKWVGELQDWALAALLQGEDVPGWKAVEGRSNRAFTDIDAAFALLKSKGWDEALLYERKPITLTATETLLGKKDFAAQLADYVVKPPGKPTLAKESDKKPAITAALKAEEVFKNAV